MRTSILASRIGDYDAADFCDVHYLWVYIVFQVMQCLDRGAC